MVCEKGFCCCCCCYHCVFYWCLSVATFKTGSALLVTCVKASDGGCGHVFVLSFACWEGQVRDPTCLSSGCWDHFLSAAASTILLPSVLLLLKCGVFLPFCVCCRFSTHMAPWSPRGPSSSGLMWILVWVKRCSRLCINACCIINVLVMSHS